jgi:DNA-directed RNA polymerase specialized sigma subunit
MTVNQFLAQAYNLDMRIKSKAEQIANLSELATVITTTLTGLPKVKNKDSSVMAGTVAKIVDLQAEIDRDLERLVDLKREIVKAIKAVPHEESRVLLELRYLCYKSWEQIAVDLGYSIQHIYRMRKQALAQVSVPSVKMRVNESRCYGLDMI